MFEISQKEEEEEEDILFNKFIIFYKIEKILNNNYY